ncbi:MAG: PspC domain-containing protein [Flavobacteriales bacterium]|nr:PspC domain-containing protein [Flavobacteriales bacterium]
MNKTITANIGGFAFNIDEQAYQNLLNYLKTIELAYGNQEGGDEIIADIEARIAELFSEKLNDAKQIITSADVEEVILIMGKPEQYESEEASNYENTTSNSTRKNRKFYRDTEEGLLGGVCSGFSHYLGWDPLWLRAIFIALVLLGFAGIPIYILLWVLIPEAKTRAEKLHMRGEQINVENISRSINEELNNMGESIKGFGKKAAEKGERFSKTGSKKVAENVEKVAGGIAHILRVLIGGAALIFGLMMSVFLIVGLVGFTTATPIGDTVSYQYLKDFIFFDPVMLVFATIALTLLVGVPLLSAIYLGIRLLLRTGNRVKGIGLSLFILFLIGIGLAITVGISQGTKYKSEASMEVSSQFLPLSADSLIVVLENDPYFHNQIILNDGDYQELMKVDENRIIYGFPEFRINSTSDEDARLEVNFSVNGSTRSNALEIADRMEYNYRFKNDTLFLSPFFSGDFKDKFRDHEVQLDLYLPDSTQLILPQNIERITRGRAGFKNLHPRNLRGKTVRVLLNEVECLNCD